MNITQKAELEVTIRALVRFSNLLEMVLERALDARNVRGDHANTERGVFNYYISEDEVDNIHFLCDHVCNTTAKANDIMEAAEA